MSAEEQKLNSSLYWEVIDELKGEKRLAKERKWWLDFVFHFTDITNAIEVLKHGYLYSRVQAKNKGVLTIDSADPSIIRKTNPKLRDYVRFYFRPRTPTAYVVEGVRPKNQIKYGGAHCPVPVYFLFNFRKIIALKNTQFSDRSLAHTNSSPLDSYSHFSELPWYDIYSDGPLYEYWGFEEQDQVRQRRHAEVIYPNRISLEHLEWIVFRSVAEYITFCHLLPSNESIKWRDKFAVSNFRELFFRQWLFIKSVKLGSEFVRIQFNSSVDYNSTGPYKISIEIDDLVSEEKLSFHYDFLNIINELPNMTLELDLSGRKLSDYQATVYIDENLAYSNKYSWPITPF